MSLDILPSSVLSTQSWYTFILVLMVNKVLSLTLFPRRASATAAFSNTLVHCPSLERGSWKLWSLGK